MNNTDRIYCAVYTRKSTTEGLEQEFSTLDSQREAGLNFIASQKGQGWIALPTEYDDGGFTGANIDRPALQQLLKDIESGRVNCVVVYKVDRLSRSLTDFAKLLEFFDRNNVTFVSVTQNFNTHNSMGRLTLNILLSFAQFEREIISERTKDKMSAARKKGRWLGGMPMLGYTVDKGNTALLPVPPEAEIVKEIFNLYLQHKTLMKVATILNERGITTKRHIFETGTILGGKLFDKPAVLAILSNYTCAGKVKYDGKIYDGLHEPIIPMETFQAVQELIAANRVRRIFPNNKNDSSLLRHVLWCAHCHTRMIPTYSSKKNIKYRYYVCQKAQKSGYHTCPTKSVNAHNIETEVIGKLKKIINASPELKSKNLVLNTPAWELLFPQERRRILNMLVESIEYSATNNKLSITLNEKGIMELEKELAHEI